MMSVKSVKYPLSFLRALMSLIDMFCPEQPKAQDIEFAITQLKKTKRKVSPLKSRNSFLLSIHKSIYIDDFFELQLVHVGS